MVIAEGVEGLVTMDLRGVTLKQALDMIVHTHDCEYIVDDGIITVKPVSVVYTGGSLTKVYRLKYADAENVAKVIKKVASNDSLVQVFHPEFLNFDVAGKNRMLKREVAIQGIRRSSVLVVTDRPEKIRVIQVTIGGGFGSKLDIYPYEPIAVHLARATRCPVKLVFDRTEEFVASPTCALLQLTVGVYQVVRRFQEAVEVRVG